MKRTAVIVGATGAIGHELVSTLLADPAWERVHVLVRRPLDTENPRLSEHIVDFDDLEGTADLLTDADVFCCLGTTREKAGSSEAFRKVDHDYVLAVAERAATAQARQFLMVSAIGASRSSPSEYNRVKAETETDVSALTLPAVHIFRPSLLLGERSESRPAEDIAKRLAPIVSPLLRGRLSKYRPVHPSEVAHRMVEAARIPSSGVQIHYLAT
ncbi:NAD(P)H-binding protein [Nocardia sp. FBN12]|uniref:NAD(P)H-binding protein n=1 Tax=Nocardia sp. FBN12 TaxID=3419766 RepID=UPI003D0333D9